jgi:pimeloyl-ACP methyl ester carboxylesterase
VLTGPDGRRVAYIDHGPSTGRPLVVFHGSSTGNAIAPPMLRELAGRGYRLLLPQRPGFGLTSKAPDDAYLDTAAADIALMLDRTGCRKAAFLARDGGAATAMHFAVRCPERMLPGVLLNPRRPSGRLRSHGTPINAITSLLERRPALASAFSEMMMRQTAGHVLMGVFRRVYAPVEADRLCFEDPEVAEHLVADMRALVGRSASGFIAEHRLFADGWSPPPGLDASLWTFAFSGALWPPQDLGAWREVSPRPLVVLPGAGQLVQFTHAPEIAALFDAAAATGRTPKRGE